ncbi:helix-turn-helix transcriptional regulator [Ideonella sp.]|jgi:prophage regulatory protein|uniref:helix-turn-helix transcriptional regulator n=1 Tax=Ideonella sp. TaxID=1929293 RepID=UPI0037C13279
MHLVHTSTGPAPAPGAGVTAAAPVDALWRLPATEAATGLKKSTIYAMVKRGEFPAPVQVSARCVAWRSSAVAAWLASRQTKAVGTSSASNQGAA